MIDAHCHVSGGEDVRELLCGRDFLGVHPWCVSELDIVSLRAAISSDSLLGVGEIGLDRLRDRNISVQMREAFALQLELAAEFARPVTLHGAKCWGEVVRVCKPFAGRIPSFLFHGFSRSDGLIPEIVALNGFVSVGPAVLNDHAVNYRKLVVNIPADRLLLETDRTVESAAKCPSIVTIAEKVAELRGITVEELESLTDANVDRFLSRTAMS